MEFLVIIAVVFVLAGIAGSVIPAVPGPALSFIGLVLLFVGKQGSVHGVSLALFGAGMVVLIALDYVAPLLGAKFTGATKRGVTGGLVGMLIGLIFFPPLGIFIGAFAGAVLGELAGGKSPESALTAGIGTFVGHIANVILQVGYSLAAAVYFFVKVIG